MNTIREENQQLFQRLSKTLGSVDFQQVEKGFRNHLKQQYKLTRFPLLNSHLKEGKTVGPDLTLRNSLDSSPQQAETPPATDRSTKSDGGRGGKGLRRTMKKEGKKNTLVSAEGKKQDVRKVTQGNSNETKASKPVNEPATQRKASPTPNVNEEQQQQQQQQQQKDSPPQPPKEEPSEVLEPKKEPSEVPQPSQEPNDAPQPNQSDETTGAPLEESKPVDEVAGDSEEAKPVPE